MPGKMESFLKNHPRRPDNPQVVVEKLILPSSQPAVKEQAESKTTGPSYSEVTANQSQEKKTKLSKEAQSTNREWSYKQQRR